MQEKHVEMQKKTETDTTSSLFTITSSLKKPPVFSGGFCLNMLYPNKQGVWQVCRSRYIYLKFLPD